MIEIRNLSFTYPAAHTPAVSHVTLSIERGEIFGLLGPSGAGKSTIQKILIGLLRRYEGTVIAFGRDLNVWGQDYYERTGISFEFPTHYLKLTALENLDYFRSLYRGPTEEPAQLLEWIGLAEDGHRRVSHFSKGMRNRLNVARALLHRPELLFLDEPTSGLDPVSARRIKELIRQKQAEGTTVFLTTHNMAVADDLCDRVAFIVDGAISVVGAPRELKLQHGIRSVRVEYGANACSRAAEFPLEGLADNTRFLDLLRHENIQTIHTLEPSLEDIFIRVTGRNLS